MSVSAPGEAPLQRRVVEFQTAEGGAQTVPASDLVVQVVQLQPGVVAPVEGLQGLPPAHRQGQREHGEPQHREHHQPAPQRPLRRLHLAAAGVLEGVARLEVLI